MIEGMCGYIQACVIGLPFNYRIMTMYVAVHGVGVGIAVMVGVIWWHSVFLAYMLFG